MTQPVDVWAQEPPSLTTESLARQEEEWPQRQESEELRAFQARQAAAQQDPQQLPDPQPGHGRTQGRQQRGAVDAAYFEALAGDIDPPQA